MTNDTKLSRQRISWKNERKSTGTKSNKLTNNFREIRIDGNNALFRMLSRYWWCGLPYFWCNMRLNLNVILPHRGVWCRFYYRLLFLRRPNYCRLRPMNVLMNIVGRKSTDNNRPLRHINHLVLVKQPHSENRTRRQQSRQRTHSILDVNDLLMFLDTSHTFLIIKVVDVCVCRQLVMRVVQCAHNRTSMSILRSP